MIISKWGHRVQRGSRAFKQFVHEALLLFHEEDLRRSMTGDQTWPTIAPIPSTEVSVPRHYRENAKLHRRRSANWLTHLREGSPLNVCSF
jgi:hypothetical protein